MLALSIFIVTLVLVIWQPKGLGIGWSALAGAMAALALGVVKLADVSLVWHIVWDATFTFVALIIISLLLDAAGFFGWAALHVAHWGGGKGRWLFCLIVILGSVIAAFFANDGAALLLTPIVIGILLRLDFSPKAALLFIIACGFIADTTSLPLITSNLVNIVTANYFDIGFGRYAAVMIPVDSVALVASLAVLWSAFGRRLPTRYNTSEVGDPKAAIKDPLVCRAAFPLLALLLIAYFVSAPLGLPVSLLTSIAAFLLLAIAGRWWQAGRGATLSITTAIKQTPWQIVLFSLGMYLVVYGLGKAGLTHHGAELLDWLAQQGRWAATLGTGLLAALVASIMNNMPSTLVSALAIDHSQATGTTRELMIYASVIGNDLGPKLTPIGSLATLLWLHVLASKGHKIGWGYYMKIGLMITPPVLLAALTALILWLPALG